jgi:hypothetical protein
LEKYIRIKRRSSNMRTRKLFGVGVALMALLLVVAPLALAQGSVVPSVTVKDQPIVNDTVTVDKVVSDGPGWITIHTDNNGEPGDVIGYSAVDNGDNTNVTVTITSTLSTPVLYAMLHVDKGTVGKYEFPGADIPATYNGQVVMESFNVTTGVTPTVVPTVGATSTVTTTGNLTATATPGTLPVTGGSSIPWSLVVLALGGLILVGGMGLALARRS